LFIELPVQHMKTTSAEHGQNMARTCSAHVLPMFCPCSALVVFMCWTGNSMNNLLSYCGLIDAKIRASDKDLPVRNALWKKVQMKKRVRKSIATTNHSDAIFIEFRS
jgi:hypothetical protein